MSRKLPNAGTGTVSVVAALLLLSGCRCLKIDPTYREVRAPRHSGWTNLPCPVSPAQSPHAEAAPWDDIGLNDEVWVIAKVEGTESDSKDAPTQGELRTQVEDRDVVLPLRHTDVQAHISGFISAVDVTQQYHNPYDTKIEAVYVFPLPQNAAVTDFVMVVGHRRIRGLVREREEAEELYREAKQQGFRAALLRQERPNIFTQSVANIEPGKAIDIRISYFSPLRYVDGEFEFVFPMVVGPRFNPPGSTDGVGAVGRGKRGHSGQSIEVQYLKPGERSGHDIAVSLDIDAGVSVEQVRSNSHAIDVERSTPSRVRVVLKPNDRIPNRDLVVRYRTAGKSVKTGMMIHRGTHGNTFALLLQPPAQLNDVPRMPQEMVFVLDCSGSMSGAPMTKAKAAMRRCLRNLEPTDTFQIIRFSEAASAFGRNPVPATPKNVARALTYVRKLRGGGGTMMIEGIKAALEFPHDPSRFRTVSFMTDGYIGNENQIFAAIQSRLGQTRIFSFGIGNSVNRHLLQGMASFGMGAAAYIGLDDSAAENVDRFYDRIAHPALADIAIDWGSMRVSDVFPRVIPDVFVGRPVLVCGRFEGTGATEIRISGRTGRERCTFPATVDLDRQEAQHNAVSGIWARWKLRQLAREEVTRPSKKLRHEIIRTSVENRLISRYTAFLAVDSLERTRGDHGVSVNVPVPVPDGVRYDTTVR